MDLAACYPRKAVKHTHSSVITGMNWVVYVPQQQNTNKDYITLRKFTNYIITDNIFN